MADNYVIPEGSLQEDIFLTKYAYPSETKWVQASKRVATHVAKAETDEDRAKFEKKFFDAINHAEFIPGGRIMFGAGRNNYNMLNCYVLDPEDSVDSIGKCINDMYRISCAGGGIGFNFSKIRPKGESIGNIPYSAPGSISTMKMINEIGTHVRAGKNRRTALMSILDISHPDLLEFLSVKLDREELTNFNISVAVTDRFLEAVEADEEWYFTYGGRHNRYYVYEVTRNHSDGTSSPVRVVAKTPEDSIEIAKVYHLKNFDDVFESPVKCTVKAKELWDNLLTNAIECGEPGIFNIDFSNEFTNVSYFEYMNSTNPCGEEVLPAYGNCCLGHVNLAEMVDDEGEIDWRKLARTIRTGVRFLDNVLTVNTFPIHECIEAGTRSRRIGLGVLGFHTFLIKAGYRYGSEECLEFTDRLFTTIRDEAYKASMYLAKERGSFTAYNWSKLKDEKFMKSIPSRIRTEIKKYGIRNAVLLTVAPTGTVAMVAGVSTGIEPIFSPVYKRRWRTGTEDVWNETTFVDPLFKKQYLLGKDVSHITGAYDITPEEHIKMQVVIQSKIDSAISKTCNLPSNFTLTPEVSDFLLESIKELKGFTFYKAGSRGNEPLEIVDWTKLDLDKLIVDNDVVYMTESIDSCKDGLCEI